ncbi:MAG: acetylxylan esterase [Acidobacteria bacterium]|nr:acetylxylan esterase [Acidobacteriota bacterium]MBI3469865.1 acetylxylan esterase [Candidatus Solibacter usitatus]
MTRREVLALFAAPQSVGYRDYSRCLPDYIRNLAESAYRRRNQALAELTTPEKIHARRQWARETFWKLAGGAPARSPLNARVTGSFERPGYRVEKLLYESRPEFHVPANLYIPSTGRPPFPGVLFQMGHSFNGKAYDSYQRCCQALARLGFLVLAFDPMGQGERVYYPNAQGTRTRLGSSDDEHTVPGKQMILYGETASRLQVWDAVRSLDYLAAHPLADPKRLASTGQSGGGTLTMLLAAVDDRLACAAVAMGNTENFACAGFNAPGSTDDAEQDFLGSGPAGFDRWDLLYPLAPKPLLIGASAKDAFGTYSPNYIANGVEEYAKLARVYEILGAKDKIEWYESPLPHGLQYDSRMGIYNWFRRWLQGEPAPLAEEPTTAPEPETVLWVAPSGNVVRSFSGQTAFRLNQRKVERTRRDPLFTAKPASERFRSLRRVASRAADVEAVEVESEAGVFIPAWLFHPRRPDSSKPTLLLAEPGGRNGRWREGELYQELASQGFAVCVPDVRGIGDTAPEFQRGAVGHARSHNQEEAWAWASLILGRPLLVQRVTDLLAVAAACRNALPGRKVALAAQGKMTVPAAFAASFDSRIDSLYLSGGLISFQSVVNTEDYQHPFANFLPELLLHSDLPEVTASVAPRKVTLAGMVDAAGRAADVAEVRRLYPQAEVRSTAAWTSAAWV